MSAIVALSGCVVPNNTPPPPITPGNPGASDVQFTVNAAQIDHTISPLIYGINGTTNIANNLSVTAAKKNFFITTNLDYIQLTPRGRNHDKHHLPKVKAKASK